MSRSSSASSPETLPVPRLIRDHLEDPAVVFVFPSEITARFWLRRAFDYTPRRTLRADRFLDWGDFKKAFLRYESPGRPINRAGRLLFAWELLEENHSRQRFRQLIPPEHAGAPLAFLPTLVRLLPALSRLPELAPRWPEATRDKREDLLHLLRAYRGYLKDASLYEPSYESPSLDTASHRVLLFFPEVIEDFPEYAGLAARHREVRSIEVPLLPGGGPPAIKAHDGTAEELERVLGSVEALLDARVDPEDVVLSAAELPALEPLLARRAELRGIPLVIHRSRPVTSFPTARLFTQIRDAVSSRFSLDSIKQLLLNRALPWRNGVAAAELVRLGLDERLLRSLPAGQEDSWEGALRHAAAIGNPRGLDLPAVRKFYRALARHLLEIKSARSFPLLKERLTGFARSYLDTSRWRPEELDVFQFALDKLDELDDACSGQTPAFELWLSYLGGELYLPRNRQGGVPVYDYPVAEGVAPRYHFLVNASQEATRHPLKPLPTLNPFEEESLGIRERDLGPEHLRLYLHSGHRVELSYSRRGPSRTNLPPTLFVTRGTVVEAATADPPAASAELRERLAWSGGGRFPLVALQKAGFRHAAATALVPRRLDATGSPLGDPRLAAQLLERLGRRRRRTGPPADGNGTLRISPTSLESFWGCPFAFLLEYPLGVEREEYTVSVSDPRELGAIMHRVFERFYASLMEEGDSLLEEGGSPMEEAASLRREGGPPRGSRAAAGTEGGSPLADRGVSLDASRRDRYRSLMTRCVETVCREWGRKNPLPFDPLWLELQERARELALTFLSKELEQMAGERVTDVELFLEAPLEREPGILLVGKIDRVSTGASGTTVVDYKKKNSPSAADIFGPQASSFQVPFYLRLMRGQGRPVERAAYYSIEEGKYRFVLGSPHGASRASAGVEQTLDRLEERVLRMAARLRSGDYSIPEDAPPDCRYCDHGETCRHRYLMGRSS